MNSLLVTIVLKIYMVITEMMKNTFPMISKKTDHGIKFILMSKFLDFADAPDAHSRLVFKFIYCN